MEKIGSNGKSTPGGSSQSGISPATALSERSSVGTTASPCHQSASPMVLTTPVDSTGLPYSHPWQENAIRGANLPLEHLRKVLAEGVAAVDRRDGRLDHAIGICRRFVQWPWGKGLYLHGPVGCGKTLLATCAVRGMVLTAQEVGWPVMDGVRVPPDQLALSCGHLTFWYPEVRFVSVPRLLAEIRKTFNRQSRDDPNTDSVMRQYERCDILVLDDLGAEKATDWVREILFLVIDNRYTNGLSTICTSNLSLRDLSDVLSERIADRIMEMARGAICEIRVGSYRGVA